MVCPSVRLSFCPFVRLSICPSAFISCVYLFMYCSVFLLYDDLLVRHILCLYIYPSVGARLHGLRREVGFPRHQRCTVQDRDSVQCLSVCPSTCEPHLSFRCFSTSLFGVDAALGGGGSMQGFVRPWSRRPGDNVQSVGASSALSK